MANTDMIDSSRNPNLAPRSARRPNAGQPPVATSPISQRLDQNQAKLDHTLDRSDTDLQTAQRLDQTRPLDHQLNQQRLDTRVDQKLIDHQRLEASRMQEQRIPIVEESLQVGKREVERGGVRVQSKIVERPVDESVALREEHVHVERKPVNRPVEPGDMTAFREGTIEVHERAEEVVVAKTARVVEEVIVGKEIGQKTENIHDTLRHTEVSIDRLGGELKTTAFKPFESFDGDFRHDYETNYAKLGGDYNRYAPLYRYGYNLATARQFAGKDWPAIEAEAQNAWEEQNPGTWEQVKRAVRHGWDRVTGKV